MRKRKPVQGVASSTSPIAAAIAAVVVSLLTPNGQSAHAATITKANNTTSIHSSGSWVGAVLPGSSDVGLFDGTIAAALSSTLTANYTLGGFQLTSPGGAITLPFSSSANPTLTVGSSAVTALVDMSAATQDLTFGATGSTNGFFRLGAGTSSSTYTLNVASGRTLTFNTAFTQNGNTHTLSLAGSGNIVFNNAVTLGTAYTVNVDGANVTLNAGGSNTWGTLGLVSGTLNLGNDAAVGANTVTVTSGTITASGGARTTGGTLSFAGTGGTLTIGGSNNLNWTGTANTNTSTLTVSNAGTTTFSGPVNLSTSSVNRTLTINGASDITISGVIANGGTAAASNLTYSGGGTLKLTNANTYGGTTTIGSGTVQVGDAGTTGTLGTGTVANAAALVFNRTDGLPVGNVISGAGTVSQNGSGTTTLSGASTSTGSFNVNAGILAAGLSNNAANPTSSALGNPQNGTRAVNVNTGGTLRFDAGDVLGGATTTVATPIVIAQGATVTNTGGFFNSLGPVTLNGGTLTGNGGAVAANYEMYRLGGTVTVGGVTASTITGSGANAGYHLGPNTTFNVADATSSSAADLTVSGTLINQTASATPANAAGGLTKSGPGTLAVTAANTYGGTTTISAGVLRLDNASAVQNSTVSLGVTDGLAFGVGVTTPTIGGLSGAGNLTLANTDATAVTLSVGNNNAAASYSGVLSGAGSLTKIGSGTQTLTGTNTYAGNTTLSAGVLQVGTSNSGSLGGTTVVFQGGTLANGYTSNVTPYSLGQNVSVASGQTGTLNMGSRMVFAGNVTGAGTLNVNLQSSITRDDFSNSWTGFTGVVNIAGTGAGRLLTNGGSFNSGSFANATVDLGGTALLEPSNNTNGNTYAFGALSGSSATAGFKVPSQGGATTLSVGALNTSTIFAGILPASTNLTKTGTGTLTLTGNANAYALTTLSGGTLQIGNGGTAGTLGTGNVTNNATLAFNRSDSLSVANAVSGSGNVIKLGNGTTTLSAANTYTGGTTVSAGTLQAANTGSSLGSGTTDVNGGVLAGVGGGTSTTGGPVNVNSGGTITAGSGATRLAAAGTVGGDSVGVLSTGNQTWAGGGTQVVKFAGAGSFDLINMGTLNLAAVVAHPTFNIVLTYATNATAVGTPANGTTFKIAYASGGVTNGATAYGNGANLTNLFNLDTTDLGLAKTNFTVLTAADGSGQDLVLRYGDEQSAPEPTTATLLGLGAVALAGRRRRARHCAIFR